MKKILLLAAIFLLQITAFSQNPKRELRAVWLTTHLGLDWPSSSNSLANQKAALKAILDRQKSLGMNAIYFQVRNIADAMYPSTLAPWSNTFMGTYGVNTKWGSEDPLKFAIDECHARGMEFHAWLNPYRAATAAANIASYHSSHKAVTNPDWLLNEVNSSSTLRYFNPALSDVRNHIDNIVRELVTNYDLDGIHFDDYFYYAGIGTQDDAQFASDSRGFTNRSDWRRDNVTLLIQQVSNSIKALKPWVKFGISPSGIYRNKHNSNFPEGPATTGAEHYVTQHADTKKWMQDGTIDYLMPQVYWAFTTTAAPFVTVSNWWNSYAYQRHMYIGLATYRTADGTPSAFSANEISNQINHLRQNVPNIQGVGHFRANFIVPTGGNGVGAMLLSNQYSTLSLPPVMLWIDNNAPVEPTNLTSNLAAGKTQLTWTAPAATTDELQKVVRYAVYRSTSPTIDYNNSSNLIAILPSTAVNYTDNTVTPGSGIAYYYAITSLDRISNESVASNVVPDAVTLPVKLINFVAKKDNNRVRLEWSTASEINSDYFLIEKAGSNGIFNYLDKHSSDLENTTTIKSYLAIDNNPFNGTNYYRLTQVDKNGDMSKPKFTSVDFNELVVVNAKAFPNPTQKDIHFSLENFNGKSIKTKLINLYGQIVHEEEFYTQNGANQYQLGIKNELPKGQYILNLSDNRFKKNIKLIVL
ncbi:family 10 glycosylhydrolase [Pedobacter xixiisoli]|uniref:Por secretion system C-terminal sorting domain-containing protein n=1 Tax=Pedobacter xixiisoli TaxID=1476464 RepID=A0A286AEH8_9SPHI|nr:family 10 glycosylhydrolase [Pedobacter xixiisoli]SOD20306.1 Por secretion system C-terminal sorting domain-containing protein [Pedobacter xixiisoli]